MLIPGVIFDSDPTFVSPVNAGLGLRLRGSTSGYTGLKPAAVAGTTDYTLPSSPPLADGYLLASTTAGVMSWVQVSADAGGSTGQIQFNSAGAFGGTEAMTYAASGTHLTVQAQTATDTPAVFKGTTSQSEPLTKWQDVNGTVGAKVNSSMEFSNPSSLGTAAFNEFFGHQAGRNTSVNCASNVCVGHSAGQNIGSGSSNTFIGKEAANTNPLTTSTIRNVAIGALACKNLVGGAQDNTVVGQLAGFSISGNRNTILGASAGTTTTALSTGSNNTLLGFQARTSAVSSVYQTVIGSGAVGTADNQVVLGRIGTDTVHAGHLVLLGSLKWLGYTSAAADPTTTELTTDKDVAIHKNTSSGDVFLAYNDGGVIKKVALT